jgi:hypothetical protein
MSNSPFGKPARHKIIDGFFKANPCTDPAEAWKAVYRLLLWIDEGTGLAHVYDANHMQKGRMFHERAKNFMGALAGELGVPKAQILKQIDVLFKACVAEFRRLKAKDEAEEGDSEEIEAELESDALVNIRELLAKHGLAGAPGEAAAREVEDYAREFFTIGNKRKNALGEGFEDVISRLLVETAKLPPAKVQTRLDLSDLPGFRKAAAVAGNVKKRERQPKPDIAIVEGAHTEAIITAKWSMRQDRERQFANEHTAYVKNLTQTTEVRFHLITNEFDLARLDNVLRATPNTAGYVFHTVFHINLALLKATHGESFDKSAVSGWAKAGTLLSLEDFLVTMRDSYSGAASARGSPTAPKPRRRAKPG